MFDEEPDSDPHGECTAEIQRLAAQIEALTSDYEKLLEAMVARNAERDALKSDAARYRWLHERFLGADFNWNDAGKQVLLIEWPDSTVCGDLDITLDHAMKESK